MIWDAPDVGLEWYDGMCEDSGGGDGISYGISLWVGGPAPGI